MKTAVKTPRRQVPLGAVLALCALAPVAFASTAFAQNARGGGGAGRSFAGGHVSAPSAPVSSGPALAPHFAARPNFDRGDRGGYAGGAPRFNPNTNFAAERPMRVGPYADNRSVNRGAPPRYAPGYPANGARGYNGAPAYNGARGYNGGRVPGRYVPGTGARYGHWDGGYWRGGFWPRVYWGSSFVWFVPVLPAYCPTYWWNSVPYYYYNDVYYTYDSSAGGYVVTTPPPAQESSDYEASAASAPDPNSAGSDYSAPAAASAPSNDSTLYAYPKNGQSEEQQSADRQECAQWAIGQTGADGNGTSTDYQRAMTACLQGRGYSVN
jgi:hypothetical protein